MGLMGLVFATIQDKSNFSNTNVDTIKETKHQNVLE